MAVSLFSTFEGGTNGTTITTGNSGGASGNAFDVVTIGTGAGLIFSNAQAAHGTLSGKFTEPASSVQVIVEWTTSLTASSVSKVWFRAYAYFTANPPAGLRLIEALSSLAFCGGIDITTAGKIRTLTAAGSAPTTSTNTIPLNAWFRLEGFVTGSASVGQVSISLYDTPDSTTATETNTTAANLNTTGAVNGIRFGSPTDGTSFSFYLDDLGASDTAPLGPAAVSVSGAAGALALAAPAGSVEVDGTAAGATAALALAAPAGAAGVAGVTAALTLAAPAGSAGSGPSTVAGATAALTLAAPAGAAGPAGPAALLALNAPPGTATADGTVTGVTAALTLTAPAGAAGGNRTSVTVTSGYLTIPPGISWAAGNGATVSTLAPFAPDVKGPPNAAPWFVPYSGNIERLPQGWDPLLRGFTEATVTDAWFGANFSPQNILTTEMLNDFPYAMWPCTDAAGSGAASNIAPGNGNPLYVSQSKYGTDHATQAFGGNSGALLGAQSTLVVDPLFRVSNQSGMWGLTLASTTPNGGFNLTATDPAFPPIAAGVTIEFWYQGIAPVNNNGTVPGISVLRVQPTASLSTYGFEIKVDPALGGLGVQYGSGPVRSFAIGAAGADYRIMTAPAHIAIAFNSTTYAAYVNGAQTATGAWAASIGPGFSTLYLCGTPFDSTWFSGFIGFVAIYPNILPQPRILTHYQAGFTAMAGEYSEYRIERLLQAGNCTGRRIILQQSGADVTKVVSCQDIPGQPASASVSNIAQDLLPGMFLIAPTGDLFHLSRQYTWDQPPKWVLGEQDYSGEIAYTEGVGYDYDPSRIENQIQLTQLDDQSITAPAQQAIETASQQQYGTISNLASGYLQGDAASPLNFGPGLLDLANWLANTYRKPGLRLQQITVDASSNPSRWPFVLGASVGDVVLVNRRPIGSSGVVISTIGRITQTTRSLKFGMSGVAASVTCLIDPAPECDALQLDNVDTGLLDGTDVLGW